MGPADQLPAPAVTTLTVQSNTELEFALTRFWQLEEPSLPLSTIDDTDPAEQFLRSPSPELHLGSSALGYHLKHLIQLLVTQKVKRFIVSDTSK